MVDPLPIIPFRKPAHGRVTLPGSKSVTNRALVMAALADGTTRLLQPLLSRDSRLMLDALRALGFGVRLAPDESWIEVDGAGGAIPRDHAELHVGNAGTVARFLTALLVHHPGGRYRLDGDPAMRERPMRGLLEALGDLGARFTFTDGDWCFPFTMHTDGWSGSSLRVNASASSQMVSGLLLSAARAPEHVRIQCPGTRPAFVELTAEMMRRAGVTVRGDVNSGHLTVDPGPYYFPEAGYAVEPDVTAASYFMALPLAAGGSVEIDGIGGPLMQGDARFINVAAAYGVRGENSTDGLRISRTEVSDTPAVVDFETFSDTFLTLAAVAPLLPAPFTIRGIGHTRHQETDRIHAMATELRRLGQGIEEGADWIRITPDREALRALALKGGATIQTYEDHRVAMSFGILGCADIRGDGEPWLRIADPGCCAKTFPRFFEVLDGLREGAEA
ncbi:MAG: 3-phosphoshikimate 1-carboxyvinyltransferase [Opitutales bacterium]|nr:3-phosphoshikimate 1-carboxyvinyltransferase [Opitutales bacterium]